MPGYTGYKPQFADEKQGFTDQNILRDNRYYIPGKQAILFSLHYQLWLNMNKCKVMQIEIVNNELSVGS